MKITRLKITNFRGIAERDSEIGAAGAVFAGGNGAGKTSALKAIRAALAGQDIGPDAIRIGADRAEILVDLDHLTVKRAITRKGASLAVTTRDGMRAPKPQTYLTDLLGTSPLDPLDLFLAKPKDRRAQILAALPVSVTLDQIRAWAPGLPDTFSVEGHGLEVVERARKHHYDQRTVANKRADECSREAARLDAEASELESLVPVGSSADVASSHAAAVAAHDEVKRLQAQSEEATRATSRSQATRAKIDELRTKASEARKSAGERAGEEELVTARDAVARAEFTVRDLEERLGAARSELTTAELALDALSDRNITHSQWVAHADQLDAQAASLEGAIAEAAAQPVPDAVMAAAIDRARQADASNEQAKQAARAREARARASDAAIATEAAARDAEVLDAIVKALANDAPRELLIASDGIPGLALEGDDVLLDGVRLDGLCGAEQLRFAVEIARRANAKSRILVCDGLERLDPEQMDAFVREATRDGYQLLATRVASGEVVVEAIEPTEPAQAAE